jgi:dTDP-4-amino-4,6-dideoxygalactose transaminase
MNTLALDGGTPVRTSPLPPWPSFAPDEIKAAVDVLQSGHVNYWTGDQGKAFEQEYATSVGCPHGIAVANGTLALELALKALGVGPGDEVIVTPRTFVASASCAVTCGATPVFADVDPDSGNITAQTVAAVLSPRTRALIAVHLAGWPCDMNPLLELAAARGLAVIEDCAQAHGARYQGRAVGSLGHVGAFSFCQDKIMTTGGEGGLLTCHDEGLWDAMWSLKDHGKSHAAVHGEHAPGFRWVHEGFGTNARLTEMQAAMGRVMLRKLPDWVATRRAYAGTLAERLGGLPGLRVPLPPEGFEHSYYKFYFYAEPQGLKPGWNRDRIMAAVTAEGVPCLSGSCPEVYLEEAFGPAMRPAERLPVARALGETSLMVMVHPTLTEADIRDTCHAVEKVMAVAAG